MVKLGLVFLGIGVVSIPIGYKIYKNFGINQTSFSSGETDSVVEGISTSEEQSLSENQQKILNGSKDNGGCKIRIYNENSSKYVEIHKLEKNFDLTGLVDRLDTGRGACKISSSSYGQRKGADDAIEGIMIKKQTNGNGDMEEGEEDELEL